MRIGFILIISVANNTTNLNAKPITFKVKVSKAAITIWSEPVKITLTILIRPIRKLGGLGRL